MRTTHASKLRNSSSSAASAKGAKPTTKATKRFPQSANPIATNAGRLLASDSVRVLLLTNGLGYGGAERLVESLAVDLKAAGDAVRVVATTRGGPLAEILSEQGIRVSVLGIKHPLDVRIPFKLWQAGLRFRADIVHSHLAVSDIAQAAAGLGQRSARHVVTVHNPGVELSAAKHRLWAPALARADQVLAVSQAVARTVPVPCEILRPSLVQPEPVDAEAKQRARQQLGLAPDDQRPVVLSVGRLARIKGFDVLKDAAEAVAEDVHFLLIGDGPEAKALTGGRLRLLGERADVSALLPGADLLVLPSRSEGLPQIVLQGMAARLPVLATAVGGSPELVSHDQTGWLVPPENSEALADALTQALSNLERARALGEAGYQKLVSEGWTREDTARRTRALYQSLLKRR